MEKIDFILPWLDDKDPQWRTEKKKWEGESLCDSSSVTDANGACRYRGDSEMLRFWFRSVEAYVPWVNRIFFVTCGQKPEWLNENHPKLSLVNHWDFIPRKFLPTFNSNAIEMNFHRISTLSEHFVYFNDDMFLLRPVKPSFFFQLGTPVIVNNLRYPTIFGYNNWSRHAFNDYCLVNKSFDIGKSIWNNRNKWFSVSALGLKRARRNFICFLANRTLPVGMFGHLASAHLKSTFEEIWEKWPDELDTTCMHKFRADDQVNQWLAIAWNLAKGSFFPSLENDRGRHWNISPQNINEIKDCIKHQMCPQICVNDSQQNIEPEKCSKIITEAFEFILPNKSSFEKD